MWVRKRIRILFTVDGKFEFYGSCYATINVNSYDELLEDYCEDIEDLEDVEFAGFHGIEYDETIPNELEITEADIDTILQVYY